MDVAAILKEIAELKQMIMVLVDGQPVKEYYDVCEFASLVHKTEYTVREWCRLGRINAIKKMHGHAAKQCWAISHAEYLRWQREGLLPPIKPR